MIVRSLMKRKQSQPKKPRRGGPSQVPGMQGDEIISLEECKKYLASYNLTDQRILDIRNNMIGIIDSTLNAYLEGFK